MSPGGPERVLNEDVGDVQVIYGEKITHMTGDRHQRPEDWEKLASKEAKGPSFE